MKELEIEIRVRNNRLKERRLSAGLSQPALGQLVRVSVSAISSYENLRRKPFCRDGHWRQDAQKLAAFFEVSPAELFPETIFQIEKSVATRKLDAEEVVLLSSHQERLLAEPDAGMMQQDLRRQLGRALITLAPNERKVVRLRFGLGDDEAQTLDKVGQTMGICGQRVRQIQEKALRKLRHPSRSQRLEEFV